MKSVTQSYYINDSAQYRVAKRMQIIIDKEDFEDQLKKNKEVEEKKEEEKKEEEKKVEGPFKKADINNEEESAKK